MVAQVNVFDRRLLIHVQPVTPSVPDFHAFRFGICFRTPVHEFHHRIPVPLNEPPVAVHLPHGVRHNHTRVRPSGGVRRGRCAVGERVGGVIGIRAGIALRLAHVVDPFGEEGRDIRVVGCGARVDLRVAHPAESLITLRTIGGDLDEVRLLRAHRVLPELRHHWVAAGELADHRRVVVEHESGHCIERGLLREAGEFDELKPVIREARCATSRRSHRHAMCRNRSRAPCADSPSSACRPCAASRRSESARVVPAAPRTLRRMIPAMFSPRSKMNTPGFGSVIFFAGSSSVMRIGGAV